jgi:hypothetical protein
MSRCITTLVTADAGSPSRGSSAPTCGAAAAGAAEAAAPAAAAHEHDASPQRWCGLADSQNTAGAPNVWTEASDDAGRSPLGLAGRARGGGRR